jgi:hypothetical protein
MKGSELVRVPIAVVSLLLVGWFGVLARDDKIAQDAAQRIHAHPEQSDTDWERSIDQLRDAEFLNPGSEWRIIRANYMLLRDKRGALRVADSVLRHQRDSLDAWVIVVKATGDPERRAEARREIRRLNPDPATNRVG